MKKFYFLLTFFLTASWSSFAQGIVRGKVTDESGESLIGVVVCLQSNRAGGVLTDLDGNFSIKVPEATTHTLLISYVSYKTIEQIIQPLKKNEVVIRNFTMLSNTTLETIVIEAKRVKASDYFMENIKKRSASTIDYISSETMKKTGDNTVVAAIARVSGVSSSGGLITVRGIGDRYVKTTLNGSRIPTLDPLTNNIKLDLFPASLVDNIIITKTASPDQPGDWSGAYLSIETKDYPEKLSVNVESQFGYNAQTTFKDYLSSTRSSTDWLGFDTGLRDKSHGILVAPVLTPNNYQEMVALGLGDYYSSIGIKAPWDITSPEGQTYFKLGLVQLGLLAPALINDPASYSAAKAEYDNGYKKKAFAILNPDGSDYNNGMSNNWNLIKRKAPLNFSQNFSLGNQTTLFKKPFGYFLGLRYGSSIRYDPNGISQRVTHEVLNYAYDFQDRALISRETNGWSALVNLAYKFNDRNSMSFLYMPNFSGTNDVTDFTSLPDGTIAQEGRTSKNQFYEQRKQLIHQLKSEHFIPGPELKIDFNASFTKGNSIMPDFKLAEYDWVKDNVGGTPPLLLFGTTTGNGIRRFYRYLSDNIFDSRISGELPISKSTTAGTRKIKFGGAYQQNDRNQSLYDYKVVDGNTGVRPLLGDDEDIDAMLVPSNFIMTNQQVYLAYQMQVPDRNFTTGKSTIKSAFALVDYSIFSFLRLAGGMRVEHATLFSDVVSYKKLGYKYNDIRRENTAGYPLVNAADISEVVFLPSANLIFKVDNKFSEINLRLNYSKTVARPSLRELNDAAIFDNEFRTNIYGNSDLKTVDIKNYDFRVESYFKNGDNVSASVFYKDFTNHIEMTFGSGGLSWNNVGKSTVKGIEFEAKKKIIKHLEARTNVTFIRSNSEVIRKTLSIVDGVKQYIPIDTLNRPMFGQAPYVVNGMLSYTADSLGLTATISYNVQGPRLVITGLIPGLPDVYEMRRHSLDLKVSKTISKHFSVSLLVRDILNNPVRRTYKLPDDFAEGPWSRDYDSFRYGTNYLFSVIYKI
jgi:hypothetical protein